MELQRIVRDLSQFGDTVTVTAMKDSIQFRFVKLTIFMIQLINWCSASGSLGSGNIKLSQTATDAEDRCVSVDINDPVKLQFAAKYLNLFMKAATLSTRVTLCMSSDIPLKLEFKVGKIGALRYYLAPKIEDD